MAGPWIPVQRTDPIGCGRSTHNYPTLVAEALGVADFTDVSCSGAKTDHMTAPQQGPLLGGGTNPPQFEALAPNTDLVTVTIGGNDVGFSDILDTCTRLSSTDPLGNPCERQATAGGTDRYAQRITAAAPKVAGVLEGIRQRSLSATVVLVGYLRFLPPAVGCYPVFPIARGDVPYLDSVAQGNLTPWWAHWGGRVPAAVPPGAVRYHAAVSASPLVTLAATEHGPAGPRAVSQPGPARRHGRRLDPMQAATTPCDMW